MPLYNPGRAVFLRCVSISELILHSGNMDLFTMEPPFSHGHNRFGRALSCGYEVPQALQECNVCEEHKRF